MNSTPISEGTIFVHLDASRRDQLSLDTQHTHLVIDTVKNTYSFGNQQFPLPKQFTRELSKLGGRVSTDVAWAIFSRIVLEQDTSTHPLIINTDLSRALLQNAIHPLSPEKQQKLEAILLQRDALFTLLSETKKYTVSLERKIERKIAEQTALEEEMNKANKTIEYQKKFINSLPLSHRKTAIHELESMQLHVEYIKRQTTSIKRDIQRLYGEKTTIEEQGIHHVRQIADSINPNIVQKSKQIAAKGLYLTALEKALQELTSNALILIEQDEL